METIKTFKTANNNHVFNYNGLELVYLTDKNIITFQKGNFNSVKAANCIGCGVEASEITIDINQFLVANKAEIESKQKEAEISLIRASLKQVDFDSVLLTIKERNAIKKQFSENISFYKGSVTVTDSGRGKGGYFKYTDTIHEGLFYVEKNEIFNSNNTLIVSSRKKNYSHNWSQLESKVWFKEYFEQVNNKRKADHLKEVRVYNVAIMMQNMDCFKNEIEQILLNNYML